MLFTVVDDAYISARYAEHLASGHGLTYNVGEYVEGVTNLQWTLVLAALAGLGVDLLDAMVIGGLVCGLFALVAATLLTWGLLPENARGMAGVPALLLGLDPHLASATSNGLETSTMVLLVLALPWALQRAPALAALLAPLLIATRPEGTVVVAIALGAEGLHRGAQARRRLMLPALGAGLALVGLEVFRLAYYGSLVPNTFAAKASGSMVELLPANLRYLHASGPYWELVAACLVLGAWVTRRSWRMRGLCLNALFLGLLSLQVPMWMPGARLLLPTSALTAVVLVVALAPRVQRSRSTAAGVALGGIVMSFLMVGWVGGNVRFRDRVHSVLPGEAAEYAARHLAKHLEEGSVVAIRDAGRFAYHLGPSIRVAELHERALTVVHPEGRDTRLDDVLDEPPEAVITTVNTGDRRSLYYRQERLLRAWVRERGASYAYLGRVRQHTRRHYDVYVRSDVEVPALPPGIVHNRLGLAF